MKFPYFCANMWLLAHVATRFARTFASFASLRLFSLCIHRILYQILCHIVRYFLARRPRNRTKVMDTFCCLSARSIVNCFVVCVFATHNRSLSIVPFVMPRRKIQRRRVLYLSLISTNQAYFVTLHNTHQTIVTCHPTCYLHGCSMQPIFLPN